MDEITTLQADILKTLASPRRLEILHALAAGPIEPRAPGPSRRAEVGAAPIAFVQGD